MKSSTLQAITSSESVEWYTPARYVEAAREVLGGIDLDPASCAEAQKTIKAAHYYTLTEPPGLHYFTVCDGLLARWRTRTVFLNPPYGRRGGVGPTSVQINQRLWSEKLIAEHDAGNVQSAILLVNACTSEKWFRPLWKYPICFTDHRIRFCGPSKSKSPTKGNAFVYFGSDPLVFAYKFQQFGHVVQAMKVHAGPRRHRIIESSPEINPAARHCVLNHALNCRCAETAAILS